MSSGVCPQPRCRCWPLACLSLIKASASHLFSLHPPQHQQPLSQLECVPVYQFAEYSSSARSAPQPTTIHPKCNLAPPTPAPIPLHSLSTPSNLPLLNNRPQTMDQSRSLEGGEIYRLFMGTHGVDVDDGIRGAAGVVGEEVSQSEGMELD